MKRELILLASLFLALSGCTGTQADDTPTTRVLSFNDTVEVGNAEANPADQYLKVAPDGTVFLSWTEDAQETGVETLLSPR